MATPDAAELTQQFFNSYPKPDPRPDPREEPVLGANVNKDKYDRNNRGLLRSDDILQYILDTSVYPREHKALQGLRKATEEKHAWSKMAVTGDEGQFLEFLVKLTNAKNTIEVGVFTGYSLLCTALALPDDGKIIALDISRDAYNIGVPFIEEAGVAHKIEFREGPAMDSLKALVCQENNHEFFDFAFVDADKHNYIHYHALLLKLVKVGGVIAYDNTLWGGSVADDDVEAIPQFLRRDRKFVIELNKFLAADPRIEICHLSINDGLTLCRKIAYPTV